MPQLSRVLIVSIGLLSAAWADGAFVVQAADRHDVASTVAEIDGGMEIARGDVRLRVTALDDDVLRVRATSAAAWPEDASWAVAAEVRARHAVVTMTSANGTASFRTANLQVSVDRDTLRLRVTDAAGRVLSDDVPIRALQIDADAFTLRKQLPQGVRVFGLGDKTGPVDRRGGAFVNWNTDVGRFTEATDPLYKSIPFLIEVDGDGHASGLFLDNTWRSWFDVGKRDAEVLALGADGGAIDYYLINGPTVAQVVERYTALTGRPPLAPLWSLGYQQSRYSYMSSDEVRGIALRLRRERIPTDVLWLDIDFQDRNRPFTANPQTYGDLPALASELKDDGLRLVAISDLHVAHATDQGYVPYDSGVDGDHFVKRADGSTFVGEVWPGPSVFPDFTRAATREWWGGLYQRFVEDGVAGFWNDMNEPALFQTPTKTMPDDVMHRIDTPGFAPRVATHAEIHNVFGMENTRATYEGLRTLRPDERAYVMTRASYAGGQRYAATWTGDNSSTWSHLKLSVSQLLSLGLSGFAYSGADVGGFTGGASPELMTRWYEIAAFTPVFRNHSAVDAPRAEPWVDGPVHTDIRRRFIETRYRLLPYLYAAADDNSRTGAPLMRPVFYDYVDGLSLPCDTSMMFTLGRRLLVAPPPTPESPSAYTACLPAGGWYDFWTGLRVADSGGGKASKHVEMPRLAHLPVYVRAGSIIPQQPLVQSTMQTPPGPLTLDIYPGENCSGALYLDDGHSIAYADRGYLRQALRCERDGAGWRIDFGVREGDFAPWWTSIDVVVHDWSGAARVHIGDREVVSTARQASRTLDFTFEDQPRAASISVSPAE